MSAEVLNDGGPAFPVDTGMGEGGAGHQTGASTWQFPGMSLRDHFAGIALHAVLATENSWRDNGFKPVDGKSLAENSALCAYQIADAMLKARSAS